MVRTTFGFIYDMQKTHELARPCHEAPLLTSIVVDTSWSEKERTTEDELASDRRQ